MTDCQNAFVPVPAWRLNQSLLFTHHALLICAMLPILSLGSLALPTYPLLLLVAFWAGLWLAARQARGLGLEPDHIYNAGLYGFLAGLIGARLWFVGSHWENYAPNLSQAFSLSRSALSVEGGVLVGILAVLIYLQKYKVPLGVFSEAIAPGIALALVIGQVGAFLGGESWGTQSNLPWAVTIAGLPRHPVQLYEAAVSLLILGILLGVRQSPWPGFRFWLLVALYSTGRLILEIFWARPRLIGDGYSVVQLVSLAVILLSLAMMAYFFRRNSTETGSKLP
jgi:phosphatidylglycerol:prolipoprotein diacylglycerol transferase